MEKTKKTISKVVCDAISGIVMMLCILVYVVLGITIGFWHPGWLIIVGGAISVAILNIVANLVSDIKQIKSQENKEN